MIRVSNDGSGQLDELLRRLKRETEVWSRLNHRNLLPFLGVWDEPIAPWPALISPFYKAGDLKKYLKGCPNADKERIILGVASGLEYLHRHEIVHGDLKVHNVLVDKRGTPCICDFGISKIINYRGFTTSSVGTAPYMAPELFMVLDGDETFDRASTSTSSDIYSFGLLALEILTTNPLKHRPTQPILTAETHRSLRPRRADYELGLVSSDVWDLLNSCWEPDPILRPAIADLILRMPIDTSESKILAQFISIPESSTAVESLCGIIRDCQKLSQNRHAAGQLANRCHRLLLELLEQYTDAEGIQKNVKGVTECLLEIQDTVNSWTNHTASRIQSILKQEEVGTAIKYCHSVLSVCSAELQLVPHLKAYEDTHYHANVQKDHLEVLDYLAAIQNAQIIGQEILAAQRSDLTELMSMMQTLLGDSIILSDTLHNGLSSNLYNLQLENHELLPDFHLRSGEIVRIGQFPVSGTASMDIYEGLYLQREKVSIKVLRGVSTHEHSLRRFLHECKTWKAIWEVDKGKHVLPIYGFCDDVPFPYMISPWPANGTALNYVKNHNRVDYIQLMNGIALGMQVLHTLSLPVVHGDLKGAHIMIDAAGNPLISDFGLSRIVEDITGIPFSQSRGVSDSYRWFAPEVAIGQGILSLRSDVYAYGMTVLELLTHDQPYSNIKRTTEVVIRASKGEHPPRPEDSQVTERGLDNCLWNLLKRCWATEPTERPTVQEILSTPPFSAELSAATDNSETRD